MKECNLLLLVFVGVALVPMLLAESDFPPPPMPRPPKGFNLHCDVCYTMMKRVVPYCQREEQNMDFLPDFCTFNYNKVLREECDHLVDVMEYAWCPNACSEVRRIKLFTGEKICHHPLVNCTQRVYLPTPSPSPSPSPSAPIPPDCVLCEFVLKHTAVMCMNKETANQKTIYQVCMEKTQTKTDFDHCTNFLHELVDLAGTENPCDMLACTEPRVTCQLDANRACHVVEYTGEAQSSTLGLDTSGNLLTTEPSAFSKTSGLGPGDFKPGVKPYHSDTKSGWNVPARVRRAGHLLEPKTDPLEEDTKKDQNNLKTQNTEAKSQTAPSPIPISEIKMQL